MCGIICSLDTKKGNVQPWIRDQFQDQQSRGTKGFGIAYLDSSGVIKVKRSTTEAFFAYDLMNTESNLIMAHHRWPTSTDNLVSQTHPILVSNPLLKYDYLIIHNGVISNDDEVREKHIAEGYTYTTDMIKFNVEKFNDSEALAVELAIQLEATKANEAMHLRVSGGFAFVGLKLDKANQKPVEMFWGRNASNPLNLHMENGLLKLSSEGLGESVEPFKVFTCSLTTKTIKVKERNFTHEVIQAPAFTPATNYQYGKYAWESPSKATSKKLDDIQQNAGRQIGFQVSDKAKESAVAKAKPIDDWDSWEDKDYFSDLLETNRTELVEIIDNYIDGLYDPDSSLYTDKSEVIRQMVKIFKELEDAAYAPINVD